MSIDLIIVGIFFFISLILGLRSGRGVTTFRKFAVGNKNFTTPVLVASVLATYLQGDCLGFQMEYVYKSGLYFMIPMVCFVLRLYFVGKFLALRMSEFLHHFSIAESMGALYGKTVRGMTAIFEILYAMVMIAMQFRVISHVITLCLGFQGKQPLFLAVIIVLAYSIFGGIKSVTFTDVLQFFTFSTLVPTLIWLVARNVNVLNNVQIVLATNENFHFSKILGTHPQSIGMFCLVLCSMIPCLNPEIVQRIYMSANVFQAKRVFINVAKILCLILIAIILLSIILLSINSTLDPTKLIDFILSSYPMVGMRAFVCVGLLALAMSTADSLLNTAAVLFTHDVTFSLNWAPKNKLLVARTFMIVTGICSLGIALQARDTFHIALLAMNCSLPTVENIFLMAILGFRPSRLSVLLSICLGAIIIIGGHVFYPEYIFIIAIIAMIANLCMLFSSYYLLPKVPNTGWVGIKDKTPLLQEAQAKIRRKEAKKETMRNFNLMDYLARLLPRHRMAYVFLGMYILVTTLMQLATVHVIDSTIYVYVFTMLGGTIAFIYPALKGSTAQDSGIVCVGFPIFLFIFLFVVGSYNVSIQHYHLFPSIVFMTNIIVGIAFLPWRMALIMALFAFLMVHSIIPCTAEYKLITTSFDGSLLNMGYIIVLFVSIGLLFICYKKSNASLVSKLKYWNKQHAHWEHKELQSGQFKGHFDRLTKNDQDEEDVLPAIMQRLDTLMGASNLSESQRAILQDAMSRLDGYSDFIEERTYYEHTHLPLAIANINIIELIHKTIDNFKQAGIDLRLVVDSEVQACFLECDASHIEHLLLDSMRFIQTSGYVQSDDVVTMYIGETAIQYDLSIGKEAAEQIYKQLPALIFIITTSKEKPIIAPLYEELLDVIVSTTPSNATDLCKKKMDQVVDAHYGCFYVESNDCHLSIIHILPIQLSLIRDEVMNTLPLSPHFQIAETAASILQEKKVEDAIVDATVLSRALVRETILFMKKCHGDQLRYSGEPFYTHPLAVAEILLMETKDPDALLAALLHDVIEDSKVPLSYIKAKFGYHVAFIVNKVTHLGTTFRKKKLTKGENEALLRSCKDIDIRPVQVKLSDRLHNVRTLHYRSKEVQIRVAQQTLTVYIPFAESVGVTQLTKELRTRCEAILQEVAAI